MRRVRFVLWGLVAIALIGAGGLLTQRWLTPPGAERGGQALVGGPFELVDGAGNTVTHEDFAGRPFAIFFGFTHCPDICPTSLYEMTTWIEALGPAAADMRFAFVSVDPERDTPEVLRDYVGSFSEEIIPLTGSSEQVQAVIDAYRVYARKVPLDGGDYTMDHSAFVYLMDSDGRYHAHVTYGESEDKAVAKLRDLLATAS